MDLDALRARDQMAAIIKEIEQNEAKLAINPTMTNELRSYANTSTLIPRHIEAADRRSVQQAQEALQQLQSRVDRVLAVQASILHIKRVLGKLEILVVKDLAEAGIVTSKSSGAVTKQLVGIVLPELAIHQNNWNAVERLCLAVQNHLGDAKDTVRQQIRLDENANWNRRYSGIGGS